jgi:hypothetical protein
LITIDDLGESNRFLAKLTSDTSNGNRFSGKKWRCPRHCRWLDASLHCSVLAPADEGAKLRTVRGKIRKVETTLFSIGRGGHSALGSQWGIDDPNAVWFQAESNHPFPASVGHEFNGH